MREEERKIVSRRFSRVGLGLFAFLGIAFLFLLAASVAVRFFLPELLQTGWFSLLLNLVGMYGLGLPAAILIMRSGAGPTVRPPRRKLPPGQFFLLFCMTLALTYIGNVIGNVMMFSTRIVLRREIANPLDSLLSGSSFWFQIFMLLVIAPLFEEFLFRKCVLNALLPYSRGGAILVSGLAFGLCHGNFYQFFYAFFIGILFAYIYAETGKLRYTVLLHFLINLLGGVVPMLMRDSLEAMQMLSELATPRAMLEVLRNMGGSLAGLLCYEYVMWGLALTGAVLLIAQRNRFRLPADAAHLPKGEGFRTIFVNVGMILLFLAGLLFFVMSVFF